MDDRKWERWGALGGILFAVLVAITAILPGNPPMPSDSAAKISKFIADKEGEIRWSGYIGGLAVIALFWWLGSVWRLMRRNEGGSPRLTVVALSGAVFAATMATIAGVLLAAMGIVGPRATGASTRFLFILSFNIGVATEFGIVVFVGAFSVVIIRSRALPAIVGWLGVLVALISIPGGAVVASTRDAFFYIGFATFVGFLLWVVIVSVIMLTRGGADAPSPVPAPSTA